MLHRLIRMWLLCILTYAGQAWALGLGDIRLSSALNEPLRAEIELLAATPDELRNLKVRLASAETFERYGLDRPIELMRLEFVIESAGQPDDYVVRVTSTQPITEPFITFLVEAEWPRGRLLREYTLLLDPPTFAPAPVAQATQPVTAPSRTQAADSGEITRQPVEPVPEPAPEPARPAPQPPVTSPQDTFATPAPAESPRPVAPDEYVVKRGDTLWKIAERFRPDDSLTMNQTMLGIFEANQEAFGGNINSLSSGARLRIPDADEIFRINRGEANLEAQRQNEAWASGTAVAETQPSLTLIPPDDEPEEVVEADEPPAGIEITADEQLTDVVLSDEQRIYEIEQLLLDHQDSIIEIEDDELAVLRAELARLRGEEYVPVEETPVAEDADELSVADETEAVDDEPIVDEEPVPAPQVAPAAETDSPGIVGSIVDSISGFWALLLFGLVVAVGVLLFFARRAAQAPEDDATGVWNALDADDVDSETVASTQRLRALAQQDDSSIVVVEVDSKAPPQDPDYSETDIGASSVKLETFVIDRPKPAEEDAASDDSVAFQTPESPQAASDTTSAPVDDSLEQMLGEDGAPQPADGTYSTDTAINFDQSDPIAEADFHMAYGLYDQAAELINGALALEPKREDLLGKLCEIYFVWGNRDAFVDAAGRFRGMLADAEANPDWDKIVIMGQQIAGEHELFSGVTAGTVTKAVDLSLEGDMEELGLDMEFSGGPDGAVSDVIDLGEGGGGQSTVVDDDAVDFMFDDDDLATSATREMPGAAHGGDTLDGPFDDFDSLEPTAETPTVEQPAPDATVKSPTIDEQFDALDATGELASLENIAGDNDASASHRGTVPTDATAEIELDDLGLDLGGMSDSQLDQMAGDMLDDFDEPDEAPNLTGDDDFDHFAPTTEAPTLAGDSIIGADLDETAETPTISEDLYGAEFEETAVAPMLTEELDSDRLAETAESPTISEEAISEDSMGDFAETAETPQLDQDEITGTNMALGEAGSSPEIDVSDLGDAAISSGVHGMPDFEAPADVAAFDESGDAAGFGEFDANMEADAELGIDASLLDATGQTQILSGEMAVQAERKAKAALGEDDATTQASMSLDDNDETLVATTHTGDEDIYLASPRGNDEETLLAPAMGDDEESLLAASPADSAETLEAPTVSGVDTLTRADIEVNAGTPFARDADTMLEHFDEHDALIDDFNFNKTEALPKHAFTESLSDDETGEMPAPAGSTDMDLDLEDLTAALRVSEMQDYIDAVDEEPEEDTVEQPVAGGLDEFGGDHIVSDIIDFAASDGDDFQDARTMTEVGTKLDLARAYVDMGDPDGARSILEEVLDEGDDGQREQAESLLNTLPA